MSQFTSDLTVTTRASKACENCRLLKIRCLLGTGDNACRKCLHSGKDCIFKDRPPRKRGPQPKSRISRLEGRFNSLVATLHTTHDDHPAQPAGRSDLNYAHHEDLGKDFRLVEDLSLVEDSQPSIITNLLSDGIIDIPKAEFLKASFQSMNQYFPFVVVPPGQSFISLAQRQPFLSMAILTASASADRRLQTILDKRFRTRLANAVMLNGEKSLDLLQGLLVYLSWYHFHQIPRRGQGYQFTQLANGMAIDLGLNQTPQNALRCKPSLHLSHYYSQPNESMSLQYFSLEARRAYLGCYFLSTILSISWKRPNTLEHSDYMLECALSLQADSQYATDEFLLHLIQLQQLAEEVDKTFAGNIADMPSDLLALQLQTNVKRFQTRLNTWRASIPFHLEKSVSHLVSTGYHSVNIAIHEMGLLFSRSFHIQVHSFSLSMGSQTLENLLICLQSAQSILDYFLDVQTPDYHSLPMVLWVRLIFATITLYKLSLPVVLPNLPEWDVQTARKIVDLEVYLARIQTRFQDGSLHHAMDASLHQSLFFSFGVMLENVKHNYLNLRDLPLDMVDHITPHVEFSGQEKAPSSRSSDKRCPALSRDASDLQSQCMTNGIFKGADGKISHGAGEF